MKYARVLAFVMFVLSLPGCMMGVRDTRENPYMEAGGIGGRGGDPIVGGSTLGWIGR